MATAPQTPTPTPTPILAIDVQYTDTRGYAAGVLFSGPASSAASRLVVHVHEDVAAYVPGQFFRRELPPILALVDKCPRPGLIIVDGFVDVTPGRPGLGRHLYDHFCGAIPVVGVAKNPFVRTDRPNGDTAGGDGGSSGAAPDDGADGILADTHPQAQLPPGAVLRGSSKKPLYVTSAGMPQEAAEALVRAMHGLHRQPTMLKLADAEARRAAREAS